MKREIKRLGLFEINSLRMSSGGSTDNTLGSSAPLKTDIYPQLTNFDQLLFAPGFLPFPDTYLTTGN